MSGFPFDIQSLFQQAGEMQKKFAEIQEEAKHKEVQASAGGGMVTVTVNGLGMLTDLKIEQQAVDPRDVPMLQELVKAAVNEGVRKSREIMKDELSKLTGGLPFPIPGFGPTE